MSHIASDTLDSQEKSRPIIVFKTPSCSKIFFQTNPTDTGANTHGKNIIDRIKVEYLKFPKKIKIANNNAIPVWIKTAPKTNKKVFLSAIQKYLSLDIFIKFFHPTNFWNKFVSKPENSKKLNTSDVIPGKTLKTIKISNAGNKYNKVR